MYAELLKIFCIVCCEQDARVNAIVCLALGAAEFKYFYIIQVFLRRCVSTALHAAPQSRINSIPRLSKCCVSVLVSRACPISFVYNTTARVRGAASTESKIESNVTLGLAATDQQIARGRRLDWVWLVDDGAGNQPRLAV